MHESSGFLKQEVRFFMEKTFQASYVYLAALFGLVSVSRLELSDSVGGGLDVRVETLVAAGVLLVNCIYLLVSTSCMYSVIKRGLFIIRNNDPESTLVRWEGFMRKHPEGSYILSWNTDNFYYGAIALLVIASSVAALLFGLRRSEYPWVFCILGGFHVWPALSAVSLASLDRECREAVRRQHLSSAKEGAGAEPRAEADG